MNTKSQVLFVSLILIFTTVACGLLPFGEDDLQDITDNVEKVIEAVEEEMPIEEDASAEEIMKEESPSVPSADSDADTDSIETDFPYPSDATNMMEVGGTLNFQSSLTLEEAVEFYRTELKAMGYTERPLLTVIEESTFSMVFDPSGGGESIVVQGVGLGEMTNINVRNEDV